jgi:hypothetical protein
MNPSMAALIGSLPTLLRFLLDFLANPDHDLLSRKN